MTPRRVSPAAVFELDRSIENLPADVRLRSLEWGVLFAVTGRHTVAQIGAHLDLTEAERDRAFAQLLAHGLIAERPLTAGEYLRAAAFVPGEPRTLGQFLTAGLAAPRTEAPAAPRTENENNGFEPLPIPEEERTVETVTPPNPPSLSLRNVVRFVAAQAKERDAGQLDVYRAFVRVSPRLLQRNGITTLRFEEDRLVNDPELQEAILSSVRQVVGKDCPPEVFVTAV